MMAKFLFFVTLIVVCLVFISPAMAQENPYRHSSEITIADVAVNAESGTAKVSNTSNITFSGAEYTHTLGRVSIRMKPLMEGINERITSKGNMRSSGVKNLMTYSVYKNLIKEEITLKSPETVRYSYDLWLSDWVTKIPNESMLQKIRGRNKTENLSQFSGKEVISYAKDNTIDILPDRWGNIVVYVNGKDVEVMSRPFAIDATGKRFELDFDLDKKNKIITITGNLTDAQYPITVDPTERVTNGDFETGDFSGWSFSANGEYTEDCWYQVYFDEESSDYICFFLNNGGVTQVRVFQTVNSMDVSTLNFQRSLGGWTDGPPPGRFSVKLGDAELFSEDCLTTMALRPI